MKTESQHKTYGVNTPRRQTKDNGAQWQFVVRGPTKRSVVISDVYLGTQKLPQNNVPGKKPAAHPLPLHLQYERKNSDTNMGMVVMMMFYGDMRRLPGFQIRRHT